MWQGRSPYWKTLIAAFFLLCLLGGGGGYAGRHILSTMIGYSDQEELEESDLDEKSESDVSIDPQPDDDEESQVDEPTPSTMQQYEDGVIIYSHDDLKSALTDTTAQYPVIYFGEDIALTSSIELPFDRTDVALVGTNPLTGIKHTITESNSNTASDTANIYMMEPSGSQSVAMQHMTIRDIIVDGINYFGPVHFRNRASRNVVLTYQNVEYTGPQPVVHRMGIVIFDNSTFEIRNNGGATPGELAEAAQVEMRGKIIVNVASSGTDGIIWLVYDEVHPLSFTVAAGAEVEVNNQRNNGDNNVFLYSEKDDYPITFEQGSTFTYNGKRGFSRNKYPGNITIEADAKVLITASNILNHRLFELRGLLNIKSGGELCIENNTTSSYASISLESGASINLDRDASLRVYHRAPGYALRVGNNSNSTLTFDQPKRVVLLSRDNTPLYFDGRSGDKAVYIEAEQLNRWTTIPLVGGNFSEPPAQHWTTSGLLELTASGNTANFVSLTSNYAPEADPPTDLLYGIGEGEQLNTSNFSLTDTRVISFGAMETVRWATYNEARSTVSGQIASQPGWVNIQQAAEQGYADWATSIDNRTDQSGFFSVELAALSPVPAVMYVQSGDDYLYSYKTPYPINRLGIIAQNLRFATTKLAPTTVLIKRDDAWNLQVIDAIDQGTSPWTLSVRLVEQLAGEYEGNDVVLQNVLVYVDDGNISPLPIGTEIPLVVASGSGSVTDMWEPDAGILARIKTGAAYKTLYTGELEWTLSLVP